MIKFFQTRAFIATAMLMLLAGAQCVMACDLLVAAAPPSPAANHRGCHDDPQTPRQRPAAPCAHLEFAQPAPGSGSYIGLDAAALAPPHPWFHFCASGADAPAGLFPFASPPPDRLPVPLPLRI